MQHLHSQCPPLSLWQSIPAPGGHVQVEERRGRYLEAFDIVLESDETLEVVNGILQYLLCQT